MAEIVKVGGTGPSPCTVRPDPADKLSGDLIAGEAIGTGDACYINANGQVYRSDGSAVAAAADVHGFCPLKANPGDPVTLLRDISWNYAAGTLTPGKTLYLSGTVLGGLADAASTGGTTPVGFAIDTMRARLKYSL